LQSCALDFNQMMQTLRRLIYRDHKYAAEADDILTECREWLSRQETLPSRESEQLNSLINNAKSRLSIINAHFMKGRLRADTESGKENGTGESRMTDRG
ncbi:MAG: hypothetical protein ABIG11_08920, partial [bacterium]